MSRKQGKLGDCPLREQSASEGMGLCGMGLWGVWAWWLGWAWWAAEAAALCVGLAGLSLAVSLAGWWVGRLLRRRGLPVQLRGLPLYPAELLLLASGLRLARPGAPRLAALRRLADWLRPSSPAWTRVLQDLAWTTNPSGRPTDFPDGLVASLFDCLLEGGSEAAQLVLGLLASPYFDVHWAFFGRMSFAAREELFCKASLVRLRSFFLRSKDSGAQKAFLRLLHLATSHLYFLKRHGDGADWGTLAQIKQGRHVVANAHITGYDSPLELREQIRGQYKHLKNFLRNLDFLGKVRGLLRGGGWDGLVEAAYDVYCGMEDRTGLACLLRPLLPELALRWDQLPESLKCRLDRDFRVDCCLRRRRKGCRKLKQREIRDEEDCMGSFAVPLLGEAHRIPLICLRWVAGVLESGADTDCYYLTKPFFWASMGNLSPLGTRLLQPFCQALQRTLDILAAGEKLEVERCWLLLAGVLSARGLRDGGLRRSFYYFYRRLPLAQDTRLVRLKLFRHFLVRPGTMDTVDCSAVSEGAFDMLAQLLRLSDQEGQERRVDSKLFPQRLDETLEAARGLFTLPQPLCPRKASELEMAWRAQGLEPVLRHLLLQPPLPGTTDLRPNAQALLDRHTALLHSQPFPQHSHVLAGLDIYFPDH